MTNIFYLHGITAIGGAERDLLTILLHLDKKKYFPVVACPDRGEIVSHLRDLNIKTVILPIPAWRKVKSLPFLIPAIYRLYKILKQEQISLIHVNDMWWAPQGYIAAWMAGIPSVSHIRQEIEQCRIRQYWLRKPDCLLPVSDSIRHILEKGGIKPERIKTLYSGLDPEAFDLYDGGRLRMQKKRPDEGQKYRAGFSNAPVIGTVANLFPWKGLEYLVQSVAELKTKYPEIKCLIVGKGDPGYFDKLTSLAKQMGIADNIQFAGFQEDVKPYLDQMDIFVLPSLREALGIVLLEAMAMKKPVVASRVGGIPEIVLDRKTGLLVPPGDSKALAGAIQALLEDETRSRAYGEAGYQRVQEQFSSRRMMEALTAIYDNLAGEKKLAGPQGVLSHPTISAILITLNEEQNIADCLERLSWVDERIVIDAMSTDRTAEICSRFSVKFTQRPWPGFGPQKNFAIDQATGEWILIVDADERVTPELKEEILRTIQNQEASEGYEIPRRNFVYGKWIRHAGAFPDYQLRLFKRGYGYYDRTGVHEKFILKGKAGYFKNPMDHFTERNIADHFKRFDQYTTLAALEELKKNKEPRWTQCLFNPVSTFFKIYFFKKGFLDGVQGFIYSVFAAMYTFVKYAKLWEARANENRD